RAQIETEPRAQDVADEEERRQAREQPHKPEQRHVRPMYRLALFLQLQHPTTTNARILGQPGRTRKRPPSPTTVALARAGWLRTGCDSPAAARPAPLQRAHNQGSTCRDPIGD